MTRNGFIEIDMGGKAHWPNKHTVTERMEDHRAGGAGVIPWKRAEWAAGKGGY